MKVDGYYTIHGFMINELNLTGHELMAYALVYGFSKNDGFYNASIPTICKWLNCSKNTAIKAISSLIEKGFVVKDAPTHYSNSNKYRVVQKLNWGGAETEPIIYINNNNINNNNNYIDNNSVENFSNFSTNQNFEKENEVEFVEAIYESTIDEKKEKEKSCGKKEKENRVHPCDKNKMFGDWIEGHGDGELHEILSNYYLSNKELYEPKMYTEFKSYWTALTQKGRTKGKELWRTKETFSAAGRLATWARNYNQTKNYDGNRFSGKNQQKRTIQEELEGLNNAFEEHERVRRMLAEQEYDPAFDVV